MSGKFMTAPSHGQAISGQVVGQQKVLDPSFPDRYVLIGVGVTPVSPSLFHNQLAATPDNAIGEPIAPQPLPDSE